VDPVSDSLLLREFGGARNRIACLSHSVFSQITNFKKNAKGKKFFLGLNKETVNFVNYSMDSRTYRHITVPHYLLHNRCIG
jgi:hypothetical protein